MHNIIWEKPDGGLAITGLAPWAVETQEQARLYVAIVARRSDISIEIATRRAIIQNLNAAKEEAKTRFLGELKREQDQLAVDVAAYAQAQGMTPGKQPTEEQKAALDALQMAANGRVHLLQTAWEEGAKELAKQVAEESSALGPLEADAARIAFYDDVKYRLGLDSHEHEEVLIREARKRKTEWEATGRAGPPPPCDELTYTCRGHNVEVEDKGFFDGLCWKDGKPDHDMTKCREIHKDRIRAARKPILDALDVEFMRATETGDTAAIAAVAARKQALRDAPADPGIASAATPEQLKTVWPAVLGPRLDA